MGRRPDLPDRPQQRAQHGGRHVVRRASQTAATLLTLPNADARGRGRAAGGGAEGGSLACSKEGLVGCWFRVLAVFNETSKLQTPEGIVHVNGTVWCSSVVAHFPPALGSLLSYLAPSPAPNLLLRLHQFLLFAGLVSLSLLLRSVLGPLFRNLLLLPTPSLWSLL